MYIKNNDQFEFLNLFLAIILLLMVAVAFVISVPFIIYSKIMGFFSSARGLASIDAQWAEQNLQLLVDRLLIQQPLVELAIHQIETHHNCLMWEMDFEPCPLCGFGEYTCRERFIWGGGYLTTCENCKYVGAIKPKYGERD